MDSQQITTALERLFHEEGSRIVFWNDPEAEFSDLVSSLELAGVKTLDLSFASVLETKHLLERVDPTGKYLLYSPVPVPALEDDWLLDIRLYSRSFRADRASIWHHELGLSRQALIDHLSKRKKFLVSKDRMNLLKRLVRPADSESDLDRKMIACILKSEQADFFSLITLLFSQLSREDEVDLDSVPPAWPEIEKFDLALSFWSLAEAEFGYLDEKPSLRKLLTSIMVTDFSHALRSPPPASIEHQLLPEAKAPNSTVCLARWRDSSKQAGYYKALSKAVAESLRIADHLSGFEIEELRDVMTFQVVEKAIASKLRDRIVDTRDGISLEDVRAVASRRKNGYWATGSHPEHLAFTSIYDALVQAAELFSLRNEYRPGFEYRSAGEHFDAYVVELHRFDQVYRHFCEAAEIPRSLGWDILKTLHDEVEACYQGWYLAKLSDSWGRFVDSRSDSTLLEKWQIQDVLNQYNFFRYKVKPVLDRGDKRKVFVIISDAFRFEAAEELSRLLNGRYRFQASLQPMLGVLPSYTALGMAALLPHKKLTFNEKGEIFADGKRTGSTEQRGKILGENNLAVKADHLTEMKKEEARSFIRDARVVYIYHDLIDATGDSRKTESKTFQAVRRTIDELGDLVAYIVNNLNGNHVLVTADHGFLFHESPLNPTDRSPLDAEPPGTVTSSKRFVLGHGLPDVDSAWRGHTRVTADVEGDMEFLIPKGTNRFHFSGGARFVHGGAMLQEIVIPLITVKQVKGKSAKATKTKPVSISILGGPHKITTGKHRFQLIQVEAVSERVKPMTVDVGVYEGTQPVTNIEKVTFASSSTDLGDLTKWVPLVLEDRPYDKKTAYKLIIRDVVTNIEVQSATVIIDRAFTDDF